MKKLFPLLLALALLTACGPSEADIAAAIAETEAAKPTETLVPTETPLPTMTFTPEPTATPTLEPTATEDGAYFAQAMLLHREYRNLLLEFNDLNQLMASNPDLLNDYEWKSQLVDVFTDLSVNLNEIVALLDEYPDGNSELRVALALTVQDTADLVIDYYNFVENNDYDLADKIVEGFGKIGEHLNTVRQLTGWWKIN